MRRLAMAVGPIGPRVVAVLVTASLAGGCADPLVGATCRDGYEEMGGRCVLLFDSGAPRDGSVDASDTDAGPRDGAVPDGSVPDADIDSGDPPPDGGPAPDGSTGDAGIPTCDLGELLCGDRCVRPESDPEHCGACGTACGGGEVCAAGVCEPLCAAPLTMCGGLCIDLTSGSDPDNCGVCGRRCGSGICVAGSCLDAMAGHVVAVGHNYRMARPGVRQIAGNAVFLGSGSPVRVLVLEGSADGVSIRGVDRAIDQVATARGRSWLRLPAELDKVLFDLDSADVFVIYPQVGTPDATLRTLGADWARGLATFLRRGGVVVLFDGPATNAGSWQILDAAGLLSASGIVEITGDAVNVVAPGDGVALAVPLSYRAEDASVRFVSGESTVVAEHVDGPVVIHRVAVP